MKKNQASNGIWTHDLQITGRVLYRCATAAATCLQEWPQLNFSPCPACWGFRSASAWPWSPFLVSGLAQPLRPVPRPKRDRISENRSRPEVLLQPEAQRWTLLILHLRNIPAPEARPERRAIGSVSDTRLNENLSSRQLLNKFFYSTYSQTAFCCILLQQMAQLGFFCLPPHAVAWFESTSVEFQQTGTFTDWAAVQQYKPFAFNFRISWIDLLEPFIGLVSKNQWFFF